MDIKDVGQLFITGISGLSLTDKEKKLIEEYNVGGIILFKHNYSDPAQLAELVNEIQTLRDEYPLFISVDQEGGRVKRFQTHFTQFPSMFEIGSKDSPKLTFEVHKLMAEELNACGVNLNFSPCSDVWTNENNKVIGDRAFAKDAELVSKHISAAIRGLHTGGVLACAKHFPGHGNTTKDSHFDLPYIKKSLEELDQLELIPFEKASKSRAEFLMMAHLVVDSIDPEYPCTLSPKAYSYLRERLKYKKLIITDDMEMKAISDNYGVEESALRAIDAGADLLIYRTFEVFEAAFLGVKEKLKNQELKKSVIEDRVKRIYQCKKTHLAEYKPLDIPSLSKLFSDQNKDDVLTSLGLLEKNTIV